jgi:hypothetical protein
MAFATNQPLTLIRWYFTRRRVVDFARATSSSC